MVPKIPEHQPADARQHQSPQLSLNLVGSAVLHPRCRLGPNTVKPSWAWSSLCPAPTPSFPCGLPSRRLPTGHSRQMLAGDRGGWRRRTSLFLRSADTPIIGGSTSCRRPPCEVLVPDSIGPVGLHLEDTALPGSTSLAADTEFWYEVPPALRNHPRPHQQAWALPP